MPRTYYFLGTTKRETTTSTIVSEWQRLRTVGMINRQLCDFRQCWRYCGIPWRWSRGRAPDTSRDIFPPFSHSITMQKRLLLRHSKQLTQKWDDDDHQYRQTTASNQQSADLWPHLRPCEARICKCYHCSCSTSGDIFRQSLHVDGTSLTKLTVRYIRGGVRT